MKNKITTKINASQTNDFTASSLPLTMELADIVKALIMPELNKETLSLPFHDRVFAWLMPFMERDLVLFHGEAGPKLDQLFGSGAIEHMDQELLTMLSNEIERIRPGTIDLLSLLSSTPGNELCTQINRRQAPNSSSQGIQEEQEMKKPLINNTLLAHFQSSCQKHAHTPLPLSAGTAQAYSSQEDQYPAHPR